MSQTTPEISEAERVYRRAWRKAFRPDPLTAPRRPPYLGSFRAPAKSYAGLQRFACKITGLAWASRSFSRSIFLICGLGSF